ncbi:hypothetical protein [Pseudonocardia hydrocarbonoxydans]|uniref:Uncharacterized protein n=1 Tax=Pseudonocardia hydrocarbonoxydans TaxID=76726 RepID=A0A4Y3WRS7_9PSEU|nr:hypothetical protein [Pseudonocardia hydrocarbonoxydans]GEC20981.1 hypothetical protein PHY01_32640 [Pseudonocardia hydrocarbonoxydans]
MPFVHSKGVAVSVNAKPLGTFSNSVTFGRTADTHDVTTFGKNSKVYAPGLKDGTASISGIYDSTAVNGPGAVLRPLVGAAAVPLVYQPEGSTGAGRPTATVQVLVTGYEESSAVADMVMWSCELQLSDDIADTVTS